ncbi:hypothetical protein [Rhodalgimonas zhirmunskyi]|uniref:Uncharacterized protein n=1 Tax=Rhodalgimonas zhirmunskyi TaxID=2964767 RepID=A0AAJ1U912_9RHOB|nr:hypothetical protein [Rhodoalgimonas zhirmunskyi]MDQ2095189.1 hypothetical protein [Rhodoalgimonas zhirmunskyi]
MKKLFYTATLASSLALASMAQAEIVPVKEVDVEVDMTAVQDAPAAGKWAELSSDLEAAILERLAGQITDDQKAAVVMVDIDEVSLASNFAAALGKDSHLTGVVEINDVTSVAKSEERDTNLAFYKLDVTAMSIGEYLPEGFDLASAPDDDVYYNAMVQAFADNIASRLQ